MKTLKQMLDVLKVLFCQIKQKLYEAWLKIKVLGRQFIATFKRAFK